MTDEVEPDQPVESFPRTQGITPLALSRKQARALDVIKRILTAPADSQWQLRYHPALHTAQGRARKIGSGMQYTVYDLENGRVFKRPATRLEQLARVFDWKFPFRTSSVWSVIPHARQMKKDALSSLGRLGPLLPKLGRELGHPVIHDDFSYEQDRATVVEDYFLHHDFAQNTALIDRYVALLFRFWEHGFNDRPFKFCFNFGIGADGQLILLDLGELYFEKKKALERIHARHWEMLRLRDDRLNAYYRSAMEAAMTVANLETYWGRAL